MNDRSPAGGDQSTLRRLNSSGVLLALRTHGPQTLRELANRTGLSRPTVEAVAADLLELGWAEERPAEVRGVGRPARTYRFRAEAGFVLGIEIGAHTVSGVLADLGGTVTTSRRVAVTPELAQQERLSAVRVVAQRCLKVARVPRAALRAVGVTTPGVVDRSGRVVMTNALPEWTGLQLASEVGRFFSCPVLVENDANAAAVAERWRGMAADVDDAVYILLGERFGAGVLIGGRPHRGYRGAAGEIAFEDFLGLASAMKKVDDKVFAAARADDAGAAATVEEFITALAENIAAMARTVDPELVVIGGGLAQATSPFLPRLERALQELCLIPPRIRLSTLGDESAALGAVRLALDEVEQTLFTP